MTIFGPVPPSTVQYNITNDDPLFNSTSQIVISGGASGTTTLHGVPDGNIITGSNQNINVLLAVLGSTYAVAPGASGNINFAVSLLGVNDIYVGGTASISTAASLLTGLNIHVDGGNATLGNGFIAGALGGSSVTLSDGGTFSNSGALISALNGSTINYGPGGGTFVANAGGAVLNLSGTTINGFANGNDGLNHIQFQNLSATPGTYSITNGTNSQTITVLDANGNTIASVTIAGTTLNPGVYTPGDGGPLTVSGDGTSLTITDAPTACFLPGTQIRTPSGDIAIEDIRVGDEVLVFANGQDEVRAVIWVGSGHVNVRSDLPSDVAGYPVRILKDAISDGVPYKDLLVTPEHCFFFNGVLTPIRMLVNGRSIFYDRSFRHYTYHHIEFEEHALVYADSVLSESYLDTGNRSYFNQQSGVLRFPAAKKDWARDAAAPLCVDREIVEPLFRDIEARAVLRNVEAQEEVRDLTGDADLHLMTESGRIIRQARSVDGVALFMIPSNVSSVRIVSRTSRPFDTIGPFVDDRRYLGVLVGNITLQDGNARRDIDVHLSSQKLRGWDWQEASPCRWTNGDAELPLGARSPNAIAMLGLQILSAGPYLVENGTFEDAVLNG